MGTGLGTKVESTTVHEAHTCLKSWGVTVPVLVLSKIRKAARSLLDLPLT